MGALDGPLRKAAATIIKAFTSKKATFARNVRTYTASTGTESNATTQYELSVAPPFPVTQREANGTSILVGDLKTIVAAEEVEQLALPIDLSKDVTATLTVAGRTYELYQIEPVYSGDQVAVYTLYLRR
jgi:hypothetical protein